MKNVTEFLNSARKLKDQGFEYEDFILLLDEVIIPNDSCDACEVDLY